MTPIESLYDVRLTTLIGVAINAIETLAIETDVNPEQLLAEYLYMANKQINGVGEEIYMTKLSTHYPLLEEALN